MSSALLSFASFVVVLGVVVFIHELGHFLAAKLFGVRVEVFSLGFGKRVLGFRRGDTDYRVSILPLGGYVRMSGELGSEDAATADPAFFTAKPRWQRVGILLAGPLMNTILAVGIWWGLFMYGTEQPDIPKGPPVVETTAPGSPAAKAGLMAGDRIVEIAGRPIASIDDWNETVLLRPGKTVTYKVERGGALVPVEVTLGSLPKEGVGWDGVLPRAPIMVDQVVEGSPAARGGLRQGDRILEVDGHVPAGTEGVAKLIQASSGEITLTIQRAGERLELKVTPELSGTTRRIGVAMTFPRKFVQYGPLEGLRASLAEAWRQTGFLYQTISRLLTRDLGLEVMSGPLEIARVSKDQLRAGAIPLLMWVAFISLQLGIFNLLPIPVLDGGHIFILLIESTLRRDISVVLKERVLQVGFVLLMALFAVIMFGDVRKLVDRWSADAPKSPPPVTQPSK